jgi:hypothetical protein
MDPRRTRRERAHPVASGTAALALVLATACGESAGETPSGNAGAGSGGTSANGTGGAGSTTGGSAGTNASAGASGSSTGFAGGSFEETHVPAVPHVAAGGDGWIREHTAGLEITHSHLLLAEHYWLGTVRNTTTETLCQAFIELRFYDAEEVVIDSAIGSAWGLPSDMPESGTVNTCILPGASADATSYLLEGFADIARIAEVQYAISATQDGGEPRAWVTLEDTAWIEQTAGRRAFSGRIVVGAWPIRGVALGVVPKTAAGLPLALLETVETIGGPMAPGHSVDFVTDPFDGDFAAHSVGTGIVGDVK